MLIAIFSCPQFAPIRLYEGRGSGYRHILRQHTSRSHDWSKSRFVKGAKILHLIKCTLLAGEVFVRRGRILILKLQTPFVVGYSRRTNEPCSVVSVVIDLYSRSIRTAYPAIGEWRNVMLPECSVSHFLCDSCDRCTCGLPVLDLRQ